MNYKIENFKLIEYPRLIQIVYFEKRVPKKGLYGENGKPFRHFTIFGTENTTLINLITANKANFDKALSFIIDSINAGSYDSNTYMSSIIYENKYNDFDKMVDFENKLRDFLKVA